MSHEVLKFAKTSATKPKAYSSAPGALTLEERFDFLIAKRYTGKLEVSKIRNVAVAWKGRVGAQIVKRERELKYVKILKKEGVED